MTRFLGGRGASAVMAFIMLAIGSSGANAQTIASFDIKAAVKAAEIDNGQPALGQSALGQRLSATAKVSELVQPALSQPTVGQPVSATAKVSALYSTAPAQKLTVALPPSSPAAALVAKAALPVAGNIAREAAWLQRGGWGLHALVERFGASAQIDNEQENCMAVAVYHEARGEGVEGQLAVARVIMNRAASGKYPATWCGTVKQPWQFSFVNPRTGQMPGVDEASASWRKAKAITKLAVTNSVRSLDNDVMWYHADYVAPSWGRRLSFVQKIGTHIFYRA